MRVRVEDTPIPENPHAGNPRWVYDPDIGPEALSDPKQRIRTVTTLECD